MTLVDPYSKLLLSTDNLEDKSDTSVRDEELNEANESMM